MSRIAIQTGRIVGMYTVVMDITARKLGRKSPGRERRAFPVDRGQRSRADVG